MYLRKPLAHMTYSRIVSYLALHYCLCLGHLDTLSFLQEETGHQILVKYACCHLGHTLVKE